MKTNTTVTYFGDQKLRSIVSDGVQWFSLKDVFDITKCPEGSRTHQQNRFPETEIRRLDVETTRGVRPSYVISQEAMQGFARSRGNPEAAQFLAWLVNRFGLHTVLPSAEDVAPHSIAQLDTTQRTILGLLLSTATHAQQIGILQLVMERVHFGFETERKAAFARMKITPVNVGEGAEGASK